MITLFDEAKEDFKKDKKGLQLLESFCGLIGDLDTIGTTEEKTPEDKITMNAIRTHLRTTEHITFIRQERYNYKVFYKDKVYYVDTLKFTITPKKDIY